MEENHNLEKNLACIEKYNPELKRKIEAITELSKDIQLAYNHINEPVLTYNGLMLHANDGAEIEARKIFKTVKNSPLSLTIVFGMGIGYLFKEFAEKSKGIVILFEPDIEILRLTLELVDFSNELAQENIRIVTDIDDLKEFLIQKYKYNINMTVCSLLSYRQIYGESFNDFVNQVNFIAGSCKAEYNTLKVALMDGVSMFVENIPNLIEQTPLYEFKDAYKGKTAMIVSAGPSLDLNIETIKKNRDKFVIFCVGTALKALVRNGIKPDFLNVVESRGCFSQVEGIDLSDVYFILEPSTQKFFQRTNAKKFLTYIPGNNYVNATWAKWTGLDTSPYFSKGTVSFEALYSAKILGFEKIILVGQDLAYVNNQCYSKDSVYSDLVVQVDSDTNKVKVKLKDTERYKKSLKYKGIEYDDSDLIEFSDYKVNNLNEVLCYVKGVSGQMLPTQAGYATFIDHFREFAHKNPQLNLINSSMVGANIEGFKNIPLEEAIKEDFAAAEKIELQSSFSYDKNKIFNRLANEITVLEGILSEFHLAEEFIYKFERDFKRTKTVNNENNKYFKTLLNLYMNIRSRAMMECPLFLALSFSEDIEIQYLLDNAEEVDVTTILTVYAYLKNYFEYSGAKTNKIVNSLKRIKEVLDESVNTKS